MSVQLLVSFLIAVIMSVVSFYLIWRIKSGSGSYIALYISGMMLVMNLLGLSLVSGREVLVAIIANAAYMTLAAVPILQGKELSGKRVIFLFSLAMAFAEFLMGAFIETLLLGYVPSLVEWINNPWFTAVMGSEMIFSVLLRSSGKAKPSGTARNYAAALTAIMLASPTTFPVEKLYFHVSVWVSSIFMILSTVLIYETLYRQRLRKTQETTLSMEMILIFLSMMAGLFSVFVFGNWILLSMSMLAGMIWVIYRTCGAAPGRNASYTSKPVWAFIFIASTFVMEWFMGAALDFASGTFSTGLEGFIGSLSLTWLYSGLGAPLWDFVNLFVSVTGSAWFLVMMGTEMGLLAASKILVTKKRENKVRLGLMISAFALYTVFIPYFSPFAGVIQFIPYMWSMGIGTLGPATGSVILTGLIGTYVVSAALSFMFGSRQICSVTCMAPTMYQGTFFDSLKTYNRTSFLGRKTLTSRIRKWFPAMVLGVSLFVLASAVISYLNSIKLIGFVILGTDFSYLVYTVWFNLLWYLVFVSIPFMGTYSCVTQGWCYWGTFNQFMGWLGFFKLKVRSSDQCIACKTVDCAKACPVGLTDMRGPFVEKGYFKSYKCIGVGDCIEACPYDNIFVYDVRHYLKEKLSRARDQQEPKSTEEID